MKRRSAKSTQPPAASKKGAALTKRGGNFPAFLMLPPGHAPRQPRGVGMENHKERQRRQATATGAAVAPPQKLHAPSLVYSSLAPAKPTIVFDTYWRFAAERQAAFFRRFEGKPAPWSDDPILQQYKFTNAYRASDRVSQYLIRNVIYDGEQTPQELFFRIIVFKIFNRVGTWERLKGALGELRWESFRFSDYDRVLTSAIERGDRIYSAAYIMPSGGKASGETRKHRMHLRLVERMIRDALPEQIADASGMQGAFELLHGYPTIGSFLAYQYATDLNYSGLTNFGETEFVVPGPGARDGIRKCFHSLGGLTEADLIRFVTDQQADEFARLGLTFKSLWGRPLQYIDCQNLFCEVDKYARVFHPDSVGRTGRTRIKQHFQPTRDQLEYWYPPKWGINERVASDAAKASGCPPAPKDGEELKLWTLPARRENR